MVTSAHLDIVSVVAVMSKACDLSVYLCVRSTFRDPGRNLRVADRLQLYLYAVTALRPYRRHRDRYNGTSHRYIVISLSLSPPRASRFPHRPTGPSTLDRTSSTATMRRDAPSPRATCQIGPGSTSLPSGPRREERGVSSGVHDTLWTALRDRGKSMSANGQATRERRAGRLFARPPPW